MGYRGKVELRERARVLRAAGATMPEIAAVLGVSRSSVSLWTRDVAVPPRARRRPVNRKPSRLAVEKQAEIDRLLAEGVARIGQLSERDVLIAGAALYAGEGAKTDGVVKFANSDPAMVAFFCAWLRCFFEIDESRLRCQVYLHEGLDLDGAETFWADLTGIPRTQFRKAYRAVPDATRRRNKYVHGCAYVTYASSETHRKVMGLVRGLLSSEALIPG
jgi:hypothetical protein